jgi:Domain of unknown function (DUF222)/HNH endonuclease
MFDSFGTIDPEGSSVPTGGPQGDVPTTDDLRDLLTQLAAVNGADADESALIDHLCVLEELKGAVAAAQARVTVALVNARTRRDAARGIPADRRCQGLASEIALAKRQSPHRGARDLGLAKALVHEMPHTLGALTRGEISEWRATLVVRETAVLSREHRRQVDEELASRLPGLGDRAAAAEARRIGYRLEPGSALRRTRGANADRYVSIRPAPDTMSYLTGFLPVAQGVACQAALIKHADSLRAQGDTRGRGQIMADTMVERLTGQTAARAGTVEIQLLMTDSTLVAGADAPARVEGYGPIPAPLARQIVRDADGVWLRRLFTRPTDGSLVAMDSRSRGFDGELRRFLVARDEFCRTPWCDAPVRHVDHVVRAADGGETSADNGQGLCESCNYAKEAPGWKASRARSLRHQVDLMTPTGHSYVSTPPDLPAPDPPGQRLIHSLASTPSPLENELLRLVSA